MAYTFTTPVCQMSTITRHYKLFVRYVYEWTVLQRRYRVVIPREFTWDGASVPRWLCWVAGIHPGGLMLGPSCLHDANYKHSGRLPDGWVSRWDGQEDAWKPVNLTTRRLEADVLLQRMMLQTGLSYTKSWRAFVAVRIGGLSHWGKSSKKV